MPGYKGSRNFGTNSNFGIILKHFWLQLQQLTKKLTNDRQMSTMSPIFQPIKRRNPS
jgi:hypothetical protein